MIVFPFVLHMSLKLPKYNLNKREQPCRASDIGHWAMLSTWFISFPSLSETESLTGKQFDAWTQRICLIINLFIQNQKDTCFLYMSSLPQLYCNSCHDTNIHVLVFLCHVFWHTHSGPLCYRNMCQWLNMLNASCKSDIGCNPNPLSSTKGNMGSLNSI